MTKNAKKKKLKENNWKRAETGQMSKKFKKFKVGKSKYVEIGD